MAEAEKKVMEDFEDVRTIPEGQDAVEMPIARDFGKDLGVFRGEVKHVKAHRRRHVYHVQYEDGDSEDFDLEEYQYAYEVRKAYDAGKFRRDESGGENDDLISCDGTEDEWNEADNGSGTDDNTTSRWERRHHTKRPISGDNGPAKRKRAATTDKATRRKRVTKAPKLMDNKAYTKESVLLEFGEETDFGQAYRTMDDDARKAALDKLNHGATKGIKTAVKEKVLTTKLKTHLVASVSTLTPCSGRRHLPKRISLSYCTSGIIAGTVTHSTEDCTTVQ